MRRILVFSVVLSLFLLGGAGPAHAETITIEADDNEFIPEEVTAQVGDTIVFENVGSAPHIATASDDSFDTGNLNAGDSEEVTLEEEGTIDYVCSYHVALGMEGTIIVEAAAGAPPAGDEEEAGEEEAGEEQAEEDAEEDSDAAADEGEDEDEGAAESEGSDGAAAEEEEDIVPTQKYFPPLGVGLFVLMLLGLAPAVKEFLIPSMTASKEDTEPEPVGAPPSLAVTASAPPAAAPAGSLLGAAPVPARRCRRRPAQPAAPRAAARPRRLRRAPAPRPSARSRRPAPGTPRPVLRPAAPSS
ncbi:MAG: cupredoxin domain-containing protein, partial [Actinobacteria bacterium]|nr:cupredoxin domain-containing protein [Actinomycetota bacterium]